MPSSASRIISSARSSPTPSTGRAAAWSTCEGSDRLTSRRVAVAGGSPPAATPVAGAAASGAAIRSPSSTTPLPASTVTSSPSRSVSVAEPVPTRQGMPSSRETIAAWQVIPPESVTIAAARRISGTQSGVVMCATRTSLPLSSPASASEVTTRARPEAQPGAAPRPRSSTRPSSSGLAPSGSRAPPMVVTGRDWSIQTVPSGS